MAKIITADKLRLLDKGEEVSFSPDYQLSMWDVMYYCGATPFKNPDDPYGEKALYQLL